MKLLHSEMTYPPYCKWINEPRSAAIRLSVVTSSTQVDFDTDCFAILSLSETPSKKEAISSGIYSQSKYLLIQDLTLWFCDKYLKCLEVSAWFTTINRTTTDIVLTGVIPHRTLSIYRGNSNVQYSILWLDLVH